MPDDILVPMDDSPHSWTALEHALAYYPDSRVTVLHVLDPVATVAMGDGFGAVAGQSAIEDKRDAAASFLADAEERGRAAGVAVRTEVVEGSPSRAIPRYIRDRGVDHVIMGSHGRTGLSRILLGSVAERVLRSTALPVTIVR